MSGSCRTPCIFPAEQGAVAGDRFAPDSLHRQHVCRFPNFRAVSSPAFQKAQPPRAFGRLPFTDRTGDAGKADISLPRPPVVSAGEFGVSVYRVSPQFGSRPRNGEDAPCWRKSRPSKFTISSLLARQGRWAGVSIEKGELLEVTGLSASNPLRPERRSESARYR